MDQTPIEVLSSSDSLRFQNDQYFTNRATQDRDFIYNKLKELADGVWLWYKTPDGSQTRAYKRPPDIKALAILSDRAAGRVQQTDDGFANRQSQGIIEVQSIIKKLVDEKYQPRQISQGVSVDTVSE